MDSMEKLLKEIYPNGMPTRITPKVLAVEDLKKRMLTLLMEIPNADVTQMVLESTGTSIYLDAPVKDNPNSGVVHYDTSTKGHYIFEYDIPFAYSDIRAEYIDGVLKIYVKERTYPNNNISITIH
jgi:HSP20 family molecular chaperone IbpA